MALCSRRRPGWLMPRPVLAPRPVAALVALAAPALLALAPDALAQSAVQSIGKPKAASLPSFVDKSRVTDLVAARAAIGQEAAKSAVEAAEQERQAEVRLMSETDALARRAEQERALAAEIRAKAEALSQRFAEELAQDAPAKPAKPATAAVAAAAPVATPVATADAAAAPRVGSAVQDERTTQAMRRAADALARARSKLDEADRRVAETEGVPTEARDAGTWEKVKAEFADARRKAAEAVDSAQKALIGEPSAALAAASSEAAPDGKADPRKSLPRPFALGGTLR